MSIQERLTADLKDAMRSGDKGRVEAIRGARAALQSAQLDATKQRFDVAAREIEQRYAGDPAGRDAALAALGSDPHVALDDAAQEAVLAKEIKRRREAAEMFRKGDREELAAKEEAEIAVFENYLPKQLSAEELRPQVAALIAELGLSGPASMGKLMPALVERFKGRAEGRLLSTMARELLSDA